MNSEELYAARDAALDALMEYATEAGTNSNKKYKARNSVKDAIDKIVKILAEDAAAQIPKEFKYEVIQSLKSAALQQGKEALQQVKEAAKVPAYTLALDGAFEVIKKQGVELSAENIVEIVKAVTEYQCKVVEAQSYKDWIGIKSEAQRGR